MPIDNQWEFSNSLLENFKPKIRGVIAYFHSLKENASQMVEQKLFLITLPHSSDVCSHSIEIKAAKLMSQINQVEITPQVQITLCADVVTLDLANCDLIYFR